MKALRTLAAPLGGSARRNHLPRMASSDASTDELRAAHDVWAEVCADRLAGALDAMPIERAVLGLFAELVTPGGTVGDIGCGTGGWPRSWPDAG